MKKATYRYLLSKLTEPTALNRLKNLSEQIIDGYYVMRQYSCQANNQGFKPHHKTHSFLYCGLEANAHRNTKFDINIDNNYTLFINSTQPFFVLF